jgi:hypothetical protein
LSFGIKEEEEEEEEVEVEEEVEEEGNPLCGPRDL